VCKLNDFKLLLLKCIIVIVPLIVLPSEITIEQYTFPKALTLWIFSLILGITLCIEIYFKGLLISPKSLILSFIFIIIVIISATFSQHQDLVWNGQYYQHNGAFTYISFVILFLTSTSINMNKIQLIELIVGTITLMSIITLFQYWNVFLWEQDEMRMHWKRVYGTIGNANWLSGAMLLCIPLAMFLETNNKQNYFWRIVIAINSAALFATGTRGAYLGFVLILFVWIIVCIFHKQKSVLFSAIFPIIIGFSVANIKNFYPLKRLNSTFQELNKGAEGNLSAGESRLFIYKTSLPLIQEYALIGSGPDTFGRVYPQEKIQQLLINEDPEFYNPIKHLNIAHNEYIQLAVTLGIGALIIFLLFLFISIEGILNIKHHLQLNFYIGLSVLSYAVLLLFSDSSIGVATLFWVILGLKEHQVQEMGLQNPKEIC